MKKTTKRGPATSHKRLNQLFKRTSTNVFKPIFLVTLTIATGCQDDEAMRVERIEKLRAIGVQTNPVVVTAPGPGLSTTVNVTAFAATPSGGSIAASSFMDTASNYAQPIDTVIDPTTATTESFANLDLYSISGTVTIGPLSTAEQLALSAEDGRLVYRYGIKLESGSELEEIVGNILVYPATAEQTNYQPIGVTINTPTVNAAVGAGAKQSLSGNVTKPQDENVRISWFVSSGKVKNRRAAETEWEPETAGNQTIFMTARGMKSGSFAVSGVDVTVE